MLARSCSCSCLLWVYRNLVNLCLQPELGLPGGPGSIRRWLRVEQVRGVVWRLFAAEEVSGLRDALVIDGFAQVVRAHAPAVDHPLTRGALDCLHRLRLRGHGFPLG